MFRGIIVLYNLIVLKLGREFVIIFMREVFSIIKINIYLFQDRLNFVVLLLVWCLVVFMEIIVEIDDGDIKMMMYRINS